LTFSPGAVLEIILSAVFNKWGDADFNWVLFVGF
jgi:hypothetical protein